jgi:hypothetical protein
MEDLAQLLDDVQLGGLETTDEITQEEFDHMYPESAKGVYYCKVTPLSGKEQIVEIDGKERIIKTKTGVAYKNYIRQLHSDRDYIKWDCKPNVLVNDLFMFLLSCPLSRSKDEKNEDMWQYYEDPKVRVHKIMRVDQEWDGVNERWTDTLMSHENEPIDQTLKHTIILSREYFEYPWNDLKDILGYKETNKQGNTIGKVHNPKLVNELGWNMELKQNKKKVASVVKDEAKDGYNG